MRHRPQAIARRKVIVKGFAGDTKANPCLAVIAPEDHTIVHIARSAFIKRKLRPNRAWSILPKVMEPNKTYLIYARGNAMHIKHLLSKTRFLIKE